LADVAYLDAAAQARSMQQWIWEVRAHRVMAMYEPDQGAAMKNLDQADTLLIAARGKVSQLDWNEERAHILRVRVERAVTSGDKVAAQKLLTQLEQLASSGGSVNLQRTYEGAAGAVLFSDKKYSDAIPQLEEDLANPLSMKLLITAYRETGDEDEARNLTKKIVGWKVPSTEEALAGMDSPARGSALATKN
jgi:hypothetical protein